MTTVLRPDEFTPRYDASEVLRAQRVTRAQWLPMQYLQRSMVAPAPPAPATTLLTEELGDGQRNCLEKAVTWADPRRHELVFMDSAAGGPGHVLIRDKATGRVWDVNDGKPPADASQWKYGSAEEWAAAQPGSAAGTPAFTQAGTLAVSLVRSVLALDPSQRPAAIEASGDRTLALLESHLYATTTVYKKAKLFNRWPTVQVTDANGNVLVTLVHQKKTGADGTVFHFYLPDKPVQLSSADINALVHYDQMYGPFQHGSELVTNPNFNAAAQEAWDALSPEAQAAYLGYVYSNTLPNGINGTWPWGSGPVVVSANPSDALISNSANLSGTRGLALLPYLVEYTGTRDNAPKSGLVYFELLNGDIAVISYGKYDAGGLAFVVPDTHGNPETPGAVQAVSAFIELLNSARDPAAVYAALKNLSPLAQSIFCAFYLTLTRGEFQGEGVLSLSSMDFNMLFNNRNLVTQDLFFTYAGLANIWQGVWSPGSVSQPWLVPPTLEGNTWPGDDGVIGADFVDPYGLDSSDLGFQIGGGGSDDGVDEPGPSDLRDPDQPGPSNGRYWTNNVPDSDSDSDDEEDEFAAELKRKMRGAADHFEEWERNGPGPDEDDEGAAGAVLAGPRAADSNGDLMLDADELTAYAASHGVTLSPEQAAALVLAYASPGDAGIGQDGLAAMFHEGVLNVGPQDGPPLDLAALPAERIAQVLLLTGDANNDGSLDQAEFDKALSALGGIAPPGAGDPSSTELFELYAPKGKLDWAQLANMQLDGNLVFQVKGGFALHATGMAPVPTGAHFVLLDEAGVIALYEKAYGITLTPEQAAVLIDTYGGGKPVINQAGFDRMVADGVFDPSLLRQGGGIQDLADRVFTDPAERVQLAHPELLGLSLEYAARLRNGETIQDILGSAPTQEQQDALGDALELLGISNRQVALYAKAPHDGVPGGDEALQAAMSMRYAIDSTSADSWAHVNKSTTGEVEQSSPFDVYGFKGFVNACTTLYKGDWFWLSETNKFLKDHVPALNGSDAEIRATGAAWLEKTGVNAQFSQPGVSGASFETLLNKFPASERALQFLAACGTEGLDAAGLWQAITGGAPSNQYSDALMALYIEKYGVNGVLDAAGIQAMMDDGALVIDPATQHYVLSLDPLLSDPVMLDKLVGILLDDPNGWAQADGGVEKWNVNAVFKAMTDKDLLDTHRSWGEFLGLDSSRLNADDVRTLLLNGTTHVVGGGVDLHPTPTEVLAPEVAAPSVVTVAVAFLIAAFSTKAASVYKPDELRRRSILEAEDSSQGDTHSGGDEAAIIEFLTQRGLQGSLDNPVFTAAFIAASKTGRTDADCLAYANAAVEAGMDEAAATAFAPTVTDVEVHDPAFMQTLRESWTHYKLDFGYDDEAAQRLALNDAHAMFSPGIGPDGLPTQGLRAELNDPVFAADFSAALEATGSVWAAWAQARAPLLAAHASGATDAELSDPVFIGAFKSSWRACEPSCTGADGVVNTVDLGRTALVLARLALQGGDANGSLSNTELAAALGISIPSANLLLALYDGRLSGAPDGVLGLDELQLMVNDRVLTVDGAGTVVVNPDTITHTEIDAAALFNAGGSADNMLNRDELADAFNSTGSNYSREQVEMLIDRYGNGDVVTQADIEKMINDGVLTRTDSGAIVIASALLPEASNNGDDGSLPFDPLNPNWWTYTPDLPEDDPESSEPEPIYGS